MKAGWSYSPVIRTRDSIPAHSSFKAVIGVRVKTSRLLGDGGVSPSSYLEMGMARPLSVEGFGRGGRIKVNVSAESWTISVATSQADMAVNEGCPLAGRNGKFPEMLEFEYWSEMLTRRATLGCLLAC